jgi:hypothetical protein
MRKTNQFQNKKNAKYSELHDWIIQEVLQCYNLHRYPTETKGLIFKKWHRCNLLDLEQSWRHCSVRKYFRIVSWQILCTDTTTVCLCMEWKGKFFLLLYRLISLVSAQFGTCTAVSVNRTLVVESRVNLDILASTSVPFTFTTTQVPNLAPNSHKTYNSVSIWVEGTTCKSL